MTGCEAAPVQVEVDIAIDSANVTRQGAYEHVRGEGTITIVSDVTQELVLDELFMNFASGGSARVEALGQWPILAEEGIPLERRFRFDLTRAATCPDADVASAFARVGLIGEVPSDASGTLAAELPVVRRLDSPEELPWAWTLEVDLAVDAFRPERTITPAGDDVAWALSWSGEVLRLGPAGTESLAALDAHSLVVDAAGSALYALGNAEAPRLTRLDTSGTELWSVTFASSLVPSSLVVALPEGAVVSGRVTEARTLGGREVPADSSFVALLGGGNLVAIEAAEGNGLFVADGHARSGGGFVAVAVDPSFGWGTGLVAFDTSLHVQSRVSQPLVASTLGPDGTSHAVHADGNLFAFDNGLAQIRSATWGCADTGTSQPYTLAALSDGGLLVAIGMRLLRFDPRGMLQTSVALEQAVQLVQRGGSILGVWQAPLGGRLKRVGRLDLSRLGEVLP